MRIDAYTHFFPKKFFDKINEVAGDYKDMGKRVRSLPALYDLDYRKKIVDGHKDYQQILSYPQPPIESSPRARRSIDEFCQDHQRRLCRTVRQGEASISPAGWRRSRSMRPTPASPRRNARIKNGALGVQIYTNVAGKPLDRPQYLPFWKKMNELGKPVWLHPARGANMPDYIDEKKSLYEIWWTFGWSYETAAAMARLVFSKIMDNQPNLKIITHHFGGIVPMLEGRIGPGWDVMGSRTTDEDYVSTAQEPEEAAARLLQAGLLRRHRGVQRRSPPPNAGMEFFPLEKIIFASDCPFDPEGGTMYPRVTLRILESLEFRRPTQDAVYFGNLERITGKKLVK